MTQNNNLIKQRYLVANRGQFYCADITALTKKKYFLFLILDLGSRLIIGHRFQENEFTSSEIIEALKASRLPAGNVEVTLHTDNASVFQSQLMQEFAQQYKIRLSRGEAATHQNQAIERLNRTVKTKLRKYLIQRLPRESSTGSSQKETLQRLVNSYEQVADLAEAVHATIEEYNNTPHRADRMFKLSPSNFDQALFDQRERIALRHDVPKLAPNDNSPQAIAIAELRGQVAQKYAGDWIQFFLDFRQETNQKLDRAAEHDQRMAQYNQELVQQNRALYEQVQQLGAQLQYVAEREKQREKEEQERRLLKQKRRSAKKQPIREAITPEEFTLIMEIADKQYCEPLTRARVKVALALLYLTGLRISNLLLLQKRHLSQLVDQAECEIPIIKGGEQRKLIAIGPMGRQVLRELRPEVTVLTFNQPEGDKPIFTSRLDAYKPIGQRLFKTQVNAVLQKASGLLQKHLRSHSFRATVITGLLDQGIPIEKAKDMIGHASIGTTATYRRSKVSVKEMRRTIAALSRSSTQHFLIKKNNAGARRMPQRRANTGSKGLDEDLS